MTESNINNEGLGRFLTAQDGKRGDYTLYELALKEIKEGKLGFECWIRYEDYKAFISLKCKTWAKNDTNQEQIQVAMINDWLLFCEIW